MPSDMELTAILKEVKTIAVIGASDAPGRPVDMVGRRLIALGRKVIPVHPKRKNVWGLFTYASMTDIPEPVDIVDLFRSPEFCPGHARECLGMAHRPRLFWMQSGITSPEARAILAGQVDVVEDMCLMVELERLRGGGHAG